MLWAPLLATALHTSAPAALDVEEAAGRCSTVVDALARRPFGQGMNDVVPLLARLALRQPLVFAHYNDGEARAAANDKGMCCPIRTDSKSGQPLSPRLRDLMRGAIGTNVPNFLVGLPCEKEFSGMKRELSGYLPPADARQSQPTSSTILINANYATAHALLPAILQRHHASGRRVHLLLSDAANATVFAQATGITPASVMTLPLHAGFPAGYDAHRDAWKGFGEGDVVLLMAGPVGRLLAPEYFKHAPTTTVLELGSFFDPELGQPVKAGTPYQMHPGTWRPSCEFDGDRAAELSESERTCLLEVASKVAAHS